MALKRRCGNLYLLLVVLVPRENQHAAQGFDHHVYIRRYCPRAARLKVSICDRLIGAAAVVADATANGASRAIAAAAVLLNYVSSGCAAQAGGGGVSRERNTNTAAATDAAAGHAASATAAAAATAVLLRGVLYKCTGRGEGGGYRAACTTVK